MLALRVWLPLAWLKCHRQPCHELPWGSRANPTGLWVQGSQSEPQPAREWLHSTVPCIKAQWELFVPVLEEAWGRARLLHVSQGQTPLHPKPGASTEAKTLPGTRHRTVHRREPRVLPLGLGTHHSSPQRPPGSSPGEGDSGPGLAGHSLAQGQVGCQFPVRDRSPIAPPPAQSHLSVTQQRCGSCHSHPQHAASLAQPHTSPGTCWCPQRRDMLPPQAGPAQGQGAAVGYPALRQSAATAQHGRAQLGLSAPAKVPCEGTLIGDTPAHSCFP